MKYLLLSFILVLFINSVNAQWNSDTLVRNIICSANGSQTDQRICTDGNQGAYIAWSDYRSSPARVCIQHIDSGGYTKWQTNGLTISDTTVVWGSSNPDVAPDGKNGVFVVWSEETSLTVIVLAQHLNSSGKSLWKHILKVDTITSATGPKLTADGHGGVIINWSGYYNSNIQIYLQWLDSTGRMRFPDQIGLPLSTNGNPHYVSLATTDNNYNAYCVFYDGDTLRASKADTMGNLLWGQSGKVLSSTYHNDHDPNFDITSDGKGNMSAVWWDERRYPQVSYTLDDIYGQRLNSNGDFLWNPAGVAVDTSSKYGKAYFSIADDGNGGAFVGFGSGTLNFEHIRPNGEFSFSTPKSVTTNNKGQARINVTTDADGRAIAAWDDGRGEPNVYAMLFDSLGNYLWQPSGAPVYAGPLGGGSASGAQIISLGNGSGIAAMDIGQDIVAARFTGTTYATAVKEINNANQLWSVYPNPANGIVYLKNISGQSTNASVQLFNSIGQLISSEEMDLSSSNQQAINVGNAQGIYFLKITSDNSVSAFSLIVQ